MSETHIQPHHIAYVQEQCGQIDANVDLRRPFNHWLNKDIAEASGLNPQTVKLLLDGQRTNKAQKAALKWAIASREFNLKLDRPEGTK